MVRKAKRKVYVVHRYPEPVEWAIESYTKFSDYLFKNKLLFRISLVLLCLAIFFSFPTRGSDDYDLWFHLKYGEIIIKNMNPHIDHTQFSWTPADPDWKYVSWVAEVIFYLVYKISSIYGLYVIHYLIFILAVWFYIRYLKKINAPVDIYSLFEIMLIVVAITLVFPYIKPENFSVLFFALLVYIYFYSKITQKNLFPIFPILFLVWVNTHGGVFLGLMFISVAAFMETVAAVFYKKVAMNKKLLINLIVFTVLSYVVSLLNPYGIEYFTDRLKYLFSKEYFGSTGAILAYYKLWNYLFPKTYTFRFINTAWALLIMFIIFSLFAYFVYRKNRKIDIVIVSLNIVFFLIGMQAARFCIFYPFVFAFSVHYILRDVNLVDIKKKITPIALVLLIYFSCNAIYLAIAYQDAETWFGVGQMELVPVNEAKFVKDNKLPGPIFNDYLTGGYLIWALYPDYKVFIDPRFGPYAKTGVYADWDRLLQEASPQTFQWFTEKYKFKIAIIHFRYVRIANLFIQSPEWRLIYFDRVAFVIIHKSVVPLLTKQALQTDMSPQRFKDIKNPLKLVNLFDFYLPLGTEYAKEILKIYYNNVSKFYKFREFHIQAMIKAIQEREALIQKFLQQQQQQQQNTKGVNK